MIDYAVFVLIEFEVKLPRRSGMRDVPIFISDRESYLDHFGVFDVTFNQKILALLLRIVALILFRTGGYDTRELSVLDGGRLTMAMTL